jgi:uncharacterized protein YbjT (DUF2867 family)
MIGITAANGNIGRHLAEMLGSAHVPARLLMRKPNRASFVGDSLEVRAADLDRPETLDGALDGVTRLFLAAPGPNVPAQLSAAIEAARRGGVQQVVLVSSIMVGTHPDSMLARTHEPAEQQLLDSGMNWTILRASEFMTNTLWWLSRIEATGTIALPRGQGRASFVDPADIAAVAFAALMSPRFIGKIYHLTGPTSLSVGEVGSALGRLVGKAVTHVDVSDTEFRAGARQAGMPEALIELLSEYYVLAKAGQMDFVTPDVEQVSGRPPTAFADWASAALSIPSAAAA